MKTILLCGGLGTRLAEETTVRPKPMVEIGGHPMLWHIMNMYASHGFNEFVCALGYKGEFIKDFFLNYHALNSDLSVDLESGTVTHASRVKTPWKVHLIDTGHNSLTGGRVKRLESFMRNDDVFMLTYGDGVSDVNIKELVAFHKKHGRIATVTSVRPAARFGNIVFEDNYVRSFQEKPQAGEGWINGGFFVFNRQFFKYLADDDACILEREPLEKLAADGQLVGYKHTGFWQCMDTIRDKQYLEEQWNSAKGAPWKIWK